MPLALAALAAFAFTLGGVLMKYADGLNRPLPAVGFLVLFGAGAVAQSLALRDVELGTTYILVLGLEAALAFGFGIVLFGESVTATKAAAVLLILTGIALLRTV
jgi:quaternary ammonium compound-resistance protein SugE